LRVSIARRVKQPTDRIACVADPLLEKGGEAMETTRVSQEVRGRVLDRIRAAIATGDEAKAMRVARELTTR
jgi:hypothetical protein